MNLILGSKSPRRQELLKGLGLHFQIRSSDTDESYPSTLPREQVAGYVAKKKAEHLHHTLQKNEVLLCADTVVIVEGKILGKPFDAHEAIEMLRLLSDKKHQVMTGVCITAHEKISAFTVTTNVTFNALSMETIKHYVAHFKPFDKAGAYGIQEWIGHVGIQSIEGSYTNIVGLPTAETYRALLSFQKN